MRLRVLGCLIYQIVDPSSKQGILSSWKRKKNVCHLRLPAGKIVFRDAIEYNW